QDHSKRGDGLGNASATADEVQRAIWVVRAAAGVGGTRQEVRSGTERIGIESEKVAGKYGEGFFPRHRSGCGCLPSCWRGSPRCRIGKAKVSRNLWRRWYIEF